MTSIIWNQLYVLYVNQLYEINKPKIIKKQNGSQADLEKWHRYLFLLYFMN